MALAAPWLASAGCKVRLEAELREVKRVDFDTVMQDLHVGAGWSNTDNAVPPAVCVQADPNKVDNFAPIMGDQAPRAASDIPLPTPQPDGGGPGAQVTQGRTSTSSSDKSSSSKSKAQNGGTGRGVIDSGPSAPAIAGELGAPPAAAGGSSLRLSDGEHTPPPAPAATSLRLTDNDDPDPDQLLARFPGEAPLTQDSGFFPNNYDTYLRSWSERANGASLALADPIAPVLPVNRAEKLQQIRDLASLSTCSEPAVLIWLEDLKKDQTSTVVAVDARTVATASADFTSDALGLGGDISMKVLGSIGASSSGTSAQLLNLDSNSATLFVDVIVGVETDTYRSKPPAGLNAQGVRLTPQASALAKPDRLSEFRATCGDQWIYSIVHGSRYAAKLSIARTSVERSAKLEAKGKLEGISLGPLALDVSGTVKTEDFAREINLAETSDVFEQASGPKPNPMPSSAGCRLAYAAALPRAARRGGPVVSFATAAYPDATGALGELLNSTVPAARSYVLLIERMGRFAHQIYEMSTMPYKYDFATFGALRDKLAKGDAAYRQLMGEKLDGAQNPLELWRTVPTEIGGDFGKIIKAARDGVKEIEAATRIEARELAVQRLKDGFERDLALFQRSEALFGPRVAQSGQSYLALLTGTDAAAGRGAEKMSPRDAAKRCDQLNRQAAMQKLNAALAAAQPTWQWRLPAISEVKRLRWGANGLLNNSLPQGEVYLNAVQPGTTLQRPAFVQVDIAGLGDEPKVRSKPAPTELEATICVFAKEEPQ